MHERMLDKSCRPSLHQMTEYCGAVGELFACFNQSMVAKYDTELEIRFPYGSRYGWGIKHKCKSKHICDVFAETDAFTVMIRLADKQVERIYPDLSAYAQELWDRRYPCGEGGWLNYRVLNEEHMVDLYRFVEIKIQRN